MNRPRLFVSINNKKRRKQRENRGKEGKFTYKCSNKFLFLFSNFRILGFRQCLQTLFDVAGWQKVRAAKVNFAP